jgi:N-acetylglucosaminyl-diphospho-decaprenol L-rhamnosyltransferase
MPAGSTGAAAADAAVDTVIVNWNAGSLLRECLAALDCSTIAPVLRVVVIDNASTDGSAEGLRADRLCLEVLLNKDNRGFAAACNQGAKRGTGPWLLFLNPDVRVEPDTVEGAVGYLDKPDNSTVGIVGIQLLDVNGQVSRSCARTPTVAALLARTMFLDRICPALVRSHFLEEWDHCDTRRVDQVMGAFLLVRRALFEQLGGFDERFFLYYEDVELCLAARRAGWKVVYFAGVCAEHVGGGTTRAIRDVRLWRLADSEVLFTAKRYGRTAAVVLMVSIFFLALPIRVLHAMVVGGDVHGIIRGAMMYLRGLPSLFRKIMA